MNYFIKNTVLGEVTIVEEKGFVTRLFFGAKKVAGNFFESPIINQAFNQLEEYLQGKRKDFTLPLNPIGTSFQQKVWSALYLIPYGCTKTYKEIAERIGNSSAQRAVGLANNKNPIPIFIPCHRVISSDGSLNGYSGGVKLKEKLLKIEQNRK